VEAVEGSILEILIMHSWNSSLGTAKATPPTHKEEVWKIMAHKGPNLNGSLVVCGCEELQEFQYLPLEARYGVGGNEPFPSLHSSSLSTGEDIISNSDTLL
jgi:hypothetical protein